MASDRIITPMTVLILGGDVIIGQALELLLQSACYDVKFLGEPFLEEQGLLDGFQLLLVAPGLSAECREALLALLSSTPATARIPVLELVSSVQEAQVEAEHIVPWPCQPEELKRRVKVALLAKSETSQDGWDLHIGQEQRRMAHDPCFD